VTARLPREQQTDVIEALGEDETLVVDALARDGRQPVDQQANRLATSVEIQRREDLSEL
jgi:hypothetical protein